MSVAALLERLDGVRSTGHGRWIARCPAHKDRRASLSVRELDDGRVLVHDFAGCNVSEVLGAVGLELCALFPDREPGAPDKPQRRPFPAGDVLQAIAHEALVVMFAAERLAAGGSLSESDRSRLRAAAMRLQEAASAVR